MCMYLSIYIYSVCGLSIYLSISHKDYLAKYDDTDVYTTTDFNVELFAEDMPDEAMQTLLQAAIPTNHVSAMGWLRLVGCLKIQVSLQNTGLFCRALLQKRPIFLSILLIVATPYVV